MYYCMFILKKCRLSLLHYQIITTTSTSMWLLLKDCLIQYLSESDLAEPELVSEKYPAYHNQCLSLHPTALVSKLIKIWRKLWSIFTDVVKLLMTGNSADFHHPTSPCIPSFLWSQEPSTCFFFFSLWFISWWVPVV